MVELIFIHLPKTGGSSMLETLNQVYGAEHVRHFTHDECILLAKEGRKISEIIPESTKVIHGHIRYLEVKDIVKRDNPKVVTFMRNPIDRVVSNFYWWKHAMKIQPNHPAKHRENETLEVYITRKETGNRMTYFLKGIRLKNIFFIGFLEYYQRDLNTLGKLLAWPTLEVFHEKNSTNFSAKREGELSEKLAKKIMRYNKKDLRLFTKAQRLFKH